MAGPPPAIGPLIFRAIRASVYELPEDLVSRIEPGLDEDTKASLAKGLRVVRLLRYVWRWTLIGFLAGLGSVLIASVFSRRSPGIAADFGFLALAVWTFAGVSFLYIILASVRYHADIHRVEAFARAMHGSSMARDIG